MAGPVGESGDPDDVLSDIAEVERCRPGFWVQDTEKTKCEHPNLAAQACGFHAGARMCRCDRCRPCGVLDGRLPGTLALLTPEA